MFIKRFLGFAFFSFLFFITVTARNSNGLKTFFKDTVDWKDGKLIIAGQTNLIEGSQVDYYITHDKDIGFLEGGDIIVEDGYFYKEIDTHAFPTGNFEVNISFVPYMQSDAIKDIYGRKGEILQGEVVQYSKDIAGVKVISLCKRVSKQTEHLSPEYIESHAL